MCIPKDPIKFIFEFTGFTAAVPVVVRPGVCIHNVFQRDVFTVGADKVAGYAHLVYGSTCCCASRGPAFLERRIESLGQVTRLRRLSLR